MSRDTRLAMAANQVVPDFETPIEIKEAAVILGVSVPTLRKMAESGEVPCFRLGWKWKFRKSSLNRWVENQLNSRATKKQ